MSRRVFDMMQKYFHMMQHCVTLEELYVAIIPVTQNMSYSTDHSIHQIKSHPPSWSASVSKPLTQGTLLVKVWHQVENCLQCCFGSEPFTTVYPDFFVTSFLSFFFLSLLPSSSGGSRGLHTARFCYGVEKTAVIRMREHVPQHGPWWEKQIFHHMKTHLMLFHSCRCGTLTSQNSILHSVFNFNSWQMTVLGFLQLARVVQYKWY